MHEWAKFGAIGIVGYVIAGGISNLLHFVKAVGPMTSFGAGTAVAITFSYFANRYWTFRHRDQTGLRREYTLFFVLSGIGWLISELFIGFTHYVLGLHGKLAYNTALIVGTAAAMLFRYWSYKRWVFLPVAPRPVDPVDEPVGARQGR